MSDVEKARTSHTSQPQLDTNYAPPANFASRPTKIANPGALYVLSILAYLFVLIPPQWSVLLRINHVHSFHVQCKCEKYPYSQRCCWHGLLLWRPSPVPRGYVGVPPRQHLWSYRCVSISLFWQFPSPLHHPPSIVRLLPLIQSYDTCIICHGSLSDYPLLLFSYLANGRPAFTSYGAFWMSYATILIPGSGVVSAYTSADEFSQAIGIYLITWFILTFMFL